VIIGTTVCDGSIHDRDQLSVSQPNSSYDAAHKIKVIFIL